MGGPTLFAPLLKQFLSYVQSLEGAQYYQILLLLTDGTIHDMSMVRQLIVELSEYPVSIIIVGIGDADFEAMEELDGDEDELRNDYGKPCARDIVQFVEFNASIQRGDLAEQVLKEVPEQLCSHMERIGFKPIAIDQDILSNKDNLSDSKH